MIAIRYLVVSFYAFTLVSCNIDDNRIRTGQIVRKVKKFKYEGAVKLVDGSKDNEGNVLIFHDGKWGSVCDDEWDIREGNVVCKQLGYGPPITVTHSSQFGQLKGEFYMNNVMCNGDEEKLSNCRFDGWYKHDCEPEEVAGVICSEIEINKRITTALPPTIIKHKLKNILGHDMKLRLRGGRVSTEGRVEINIGNNSNWTVLCGEGWSLLEAQVICRQAAFGYAQMATQGSFFTSDEELIIGLSNVECRGNETSLRDCTVSLSVHNNCPRDSVAGVICTQYLADLVIDYNEIARSAYLEDRPLYILQCAMEENCLATGAYEIMQNSHSWQLETRRLLRFTAAILNKGNAEFRPALPKHLWEFHQCHMHYHSMEVFATFDVYDGNKKIAEGHKASFCLEDNQCLPGVQTKFACANYGDQGISVNCTDIYRHNIDCQWVDISDIDTGIYTLKIAINPEFKVAEMTFENNAALCKMYYGTSSVYISDCYLERP